MIDLDYVGLQSPAAPACPVSEFTRGLPAGGCTHGSGDGAARYFRCANSLFLSAVPSFRQSLIVVLNPVGACDGDVSPRAVFSWFQVLPRAVEVVVFTSTGGGAQMDLACDASTCQQGSLQLFQAAYASSPPDVACCTDLLDGWLYHQG